jgi:hypothetical protein
MVDQRQFYSDLIHAFKQQQHGAEAKDGNSWSKFSRWWQAQEVMTITEFKPRVVSRRENHMKICFQSRNPRVVYTETNVTAVKTESSLGPILFSEGHKING